MRRDVAGSHRTQSTRIFDHFVRVVSVCAFFHKCPFAFYLSKLMLCRGFISHFSGSVDSASASVFLFIFCFLSQKNHQFVGSAVESMRILAVSASGTANNDSERVISNISLVRRRRTSRAETQTLSLSKMAAHLQTLSPYLTSIGSRRSHTWLRLDPLEYDCDYCGKRKSPKEVGTNALLFTNAVWNPFSISSA